MPNGNDIVELASGQNYTVAGVLLLVCIYLAWSKYQADKNVSRVQEAHKEDLKAANNDYKNIVDKYYQFVSTVNFSRNGKQ